MYLPTSLDALIPDVALTILSHLSPRDLTAAAAVSRQCRQLAQDDLLWQRFNPSPASRSSSSARRRHLCQIAWRTARAVHTKSRIVCQPVHGVQLMTGGSVALLTSMPASQGYTSLTEKVETDENSNVKPVLIQLPVIHNRVRATASAVSTGGEVLSAFVADCEDVTESRLVNVYSTKQNHTGALSEEAYPDLTNNSDTGPASHLTSVEIFSVRRRDILSVAVNAESRGAVVFGTKSGSVIGTRHGGNLTCVAAAVEKEVTAVSVMSGRHVLAGSGGGEVVQADIETGKIIRTFVGPCSCAVSAMTSAQNVAIAGIAHAVAGNGHGSLAVAWDVRVPGRLAAFGRGVFGASSAVPAAPVTALAASPDAFRVALLVAGQVSVYDMASWCCTVHAADFGHATALDIDERRLSFFCAGSELDGCAPRLHVLDFNKAVEFMPNQVHCFQPFDVRKRKWWRGR